MTDYFESARPYTTTTILLLPAVGTSRRSLTKYGFINGYLADSSHEIKYPGCVYILFRPDNWDKFNVHLDRELKTPNFITSYDYAGGYIVLVYAVLTEWEADYRLFLEGQYSKMSKAYQEMFPRLVRVLDRESGLEVVQPSLQAHIFERSISMQKFWEKELGVSYSELGDLEVWHGLNLEAETLDIDKIRLTKKEEEKYE